jgi:hypothetical protein
MAFSEWEDCFVWQCDQCGHTVEFPPTDFWGCVGELKSRRWGFQRHGDGGWSHFCGRCRKPLAEVLKMPLMKQG